MMNIKKEQKDSKIFHHRTILIYSVIQIIIFVGNFLLIHLGLSLPSLGAKKYPFGASMITSVGAFGVVNGYGPFNYVS